MTMIPNALSPEEKEFLPIWEACRPYTMTSFERGFALFQAVRYVVTAKIPGSFVECGVWRGGSSMIAMLTLLQLGAANREVVLMDTFSGMTAPGEVDQDHVGRSAQELMAESDHEKNKSLVWAYAELDEVLANIAKTGYPPSLVRLVKGDVRETLPELQIGAIALLRLDTDFYDSTEAELDFLYPKVADAGILLIDDYGHWQGARLAVDAYFDRITVLGETRPLLQRIDYTGRVAVRPRKAPTTPSARYDYLAPGLVRSPLLPFFPSVIASDPASIPWPYLRKEVPHIWRTDRRSVKDLNSGILSVEEAELLYNNALRFKGGRALEIGCHFGWSAAHIVTAGLDLDIIDPALHHPDQFMAVQDSLTLVGGSGEASLWAGYSPSIVPAVRSTKAALWCFSFINGYREGSAPQNDAQAVITYCADDACVMFHDLASPYVAAGLREFEKAGWQIGLYNTMQIMGIAWRGNFNPIEHVSDPAAPYPAYAHLSGIPMLSALP